MYTYYEDYSNYRAAARQLECFFKKEVYIISFTINFVLFKVLILFQSFFDLLFLIHQKTF